MFPKGRTAVIVRQTPGGTDPYGDPIEDSEIRIEIPGCAWAPRTQGTGPSSGEIEDRGRQGVIEGLTFYVKRESWRRIEWPAEVPENERVLFASDQVELGGVLYEVQGDPGDWWNPMSGREAGLEVAVRRATG